MFIILPQIVLLDCVICTFFDIGIVDQPALLKHQSASQSAQWDIEQPVLYKCSSFWNEPKQNGG